MYVVISSKSLPKSLATNQQKQIICSKNMATKFYQILQRLANNKYKRSLLCLDQNRVNLYMEDTCSSHSRCHFTNCPPPLWWQDERGADVGEGVSQSFSFPADWALYLPTVLHIPLHYTTVYLLQSWHKTASSAL